MLSWADEGQEDSVAGPVHPAGLSTLDFLEIQQGNEISGSLLPISTH